MFMFSHKQTEASHSFGELAGWFFISHNSVETALQDLNHGTTTTEHPISVHSAAQKTLRFDSYVLVK